MITLVNSSSGTSISSGATIACTAFNCVAGNLLVVMAGMGTTTMTVSSIADTATNTFVQCTNALKHGAVNSTDIWYSKNVKANASNVVTITMSASKQSRACVVHQYSGCDTVNPFEVAATGTTASGTSVTSGSFSPANAGNINVGFCGVTNGPVTFTAGTGYSLVVNLGSSTNFTCASEHPTSLSAAAGAQTASMTESVSATDLTFSVASFKPAVVLVSAINDDELQSFPYIMNRTVLYDATPEADEPGFVGVPPTAHVPDDLVKLDAGWRALQDSDTETESNKAVIPPVVIPTASDDLEAQFRPIEQRSVYLEDDQIIAASQGFATVPAGPTTLYLKHFQNAAITSPLYSNATLTKSVLSLLASVTGTTASGTKIQCLAPAQGSDAGGYALKFMSPPIGAAITISGPIAFNLWAYENTLAANAGIRMELVKFSGGAEGSVFAAASYGAPTELTTSPALYNWTVSPTPTSFAVGDRIVAYIYVINVGTMAGSDTVTVDYGGSTAAADGDSWFQLTESISFQLEPELVQCRFFATSNPNVMTPGPTTSGNLLLVISATNNDRTGVYSISDDKSNNWQVLGGPTNWNNANNAQDQMWYAANIIGSNSPSISVAVTGSPTLLDGSIYEWANIAPVPLDLSIPLLTGTSSTPSVSVGPTNFSNELIIGLLDVDGGPTVTAGTGYLTDPLVNGIIFKTVTATGVFTPNAVLGSSHDWIMMAASFMAAIAPVVFLQVPPVPLDQWESEDQLPQWFDVKALQYDDMEMESNYPIVPIVVVTQASDDLEAQFKPSEQRTVYDHTSETDEPSFVGVAPAALDWEPARFNDPRFLYDHTSETDEPGGLGTPPQAIDQDTEQAKWFGTLSIQYDDTETRPGNPPTPPFVIHDEISERWSHTWQVYHEDAETQRELPPIPSVIQDEVSEVFSGKVYLYDHTSDTDEPGGLGAPPFAIDQDSEQSKWVGWSVPAIEDDARALPAPAPFAIDQDTEQSEWVGVRAYQYDDAETISARTPIPPFAIDQDVEQSKWSDWKAPAIEDDWSTTAPPPAPAIQDEISEMWVGWAVPAVEDDWSTTAPPPPLVIQNDDIEPQFKPMEQMSVYDPSPDDWMDIGGPNTNGSFSHAQPTAYNSASGFVVGLTVTLNSNPNVGDVVLCFVRVSFSGTPPTITAQDGNGNTYTASLLQSYSATKRQTLAYLVAPANASKTIQISFSPPITSGNAEAFVDDFSAGGGLAQVQAAKFAVFVTGGSPTMAPLVIPQFNNSLFYAGVGFSTSASTGVFGPWVENDHGPGVNGSDTEYILQSSNPQTVSFTFGASDTFGLLAIVFYIQSSGTQPVPPTTWQSDDDSTRWSDWRQLQYDDPDSYYPPPPIVVIYTAVDDLEAQFKPNEQRIVYDHVPETDEPGGLPAPPVSIDQDSEQARWFGWSAPAVEDDARALPPTPILAIQEDGDFERRFDWSAPAIEEDWSFTAPAPPVVIFDEVELFKPREQQSFYDPSPDDWMQISGESCVTTVYSDNFQYADGPVDPSKWTQSTWPTDYPIDVLSGVAVASPASIGQIGIGYASELFTGGIFTPTQYAEFVIGALTDNGILVAMVRSDSKMFWGNGYMLFVFTNTTPFNIQVAKIVGGSYIPLNEITYPISNGDRVRLSVNGDGLFISVNGLVVLTLTDTTIANGNPGLIIYAGTAQSDATVTQFNAGSTTCNSTLPLPPTTWQHDDDATKWIAWIQNFQEDTDAHSFAAPTPPIVEPGDDPSVWTATEAIQPDDPDSYYPPAPPPTIIEGFEFDEYLARAQDRIVPIFEDAETQREIPPPPPLTSDDVDVEFKPFEQASRYVEDDLRTSPPTAPSAIQDEISELFRDTRQSFHSEEETQRELPPTPFAIQDEISEIFTSRLTVYDATPETDEPGFVGAPPFAIDQDVEQSKWSDWKAPAIEDTWSMFAPTPPVAIQDDGEFERNFDWRVLAIEEDLSPAFPTAPIVIPDDADSLRWFGTRSIQYEDTDTQRAVPPTPPFVIQDEGEIERNVDWRIPFFLDDDSFFAPYPPTVEPGDDPMFWTATSSLQPDDPDSYYPPPPPPVVPEGWEFDEYLAHAQDRVVPIQDDMETQREIPPPPPTVDQVDEMQQRNFDWLIKQIDDSETQRELPPVPPYAIVDETEQSIWTGAIALQPDEDLRELPPTPPMTQAEDDLQLRVDWKAPALDDDHNFTTPAPPTVEQDEISEKWTGWTALQPDDPDSYYPPVVIVVPTVGNDDIPSMWVGWIAPWHDDTETQLVVPTRPPITDEAELKFNADWQARQYDDTETESNFPPRPPETSTDDADTKFDASWLAIWHDDTETQRVFPPSPPETFTDDGEFKFHAGWQQIFHDDADTISAAAPVPPFAIQDEISEQFVGWQQPWHDDTETQSQFPPPPPPTHIGAGRDDEELQKWVGNSGPYYEAIDDQFVWYPGLIYPLCVHGSGTILDTQGFGSLSESAGTGDISAIAGSGDVETVSGVGQVKPITGQGKNC